VTRYRFALWPPSDSWRNGYLWGAPVPTFRLRYPEKVKEHGPPLRVWETENDKASPADV
jgi:hypothetical protein